MSDARQPRPPQPPWQPLPERFIGAWRRASLALPIHGGEPFERQRVLWLQAGSAFADVRLPLDPADGDPQAAPVSFAGVTTWDGSSLCWHRDLDLHRVTDADKGAITWEGDAMIETGSFTFGGELQPYREVWVREDPVVSPRLALRSTDGTARLVRVGDHAITVADEREGDGWYRACCRSRTSQGWTVTMALGEAADRLPEPPEADPGTPTAGSTIRYGDRVWVVEEHTPA